MITLFHGSESYLVDRAARVGSYKWVESAKGSGLFDLSKDAVEQNDLSQKQPELLAKLKNRWAAWRKQMDEAEPRGPFRDGRLPR